ncbi:hypothetical protein J3R83DRAFT_13221, partial [Lanmaoa asiatica]
DTVGAQVGGGRYVSPPPIQTPRLRTRIKPTHRAAGFVHQAGEHRAQLAAKDATAALTSAIPSSPEQPDASTSHPVVTTVSSPEQPDATTSHPAVTTSRTSSPGAPPADLTPTGPSRIAEVQIDPILLALTTAVDLDLDFGDVDSMPSSPPGIPSTRLIPATPEEADSIGPLVLASHADDSTGDAPLDDPSIGDAPNHDVPTDDAAEEGPSTPTSGRRSARVNSILAACYDDLDKILMKAVGETSCSVQQIVDSWHKSRGRVISGTNHWNIWPSYLAKHEEEERNRAGISIEVPMSPSLRGQLYTKFKEAHNDNWREILEIHSMLELSQCSSSTVAQRTQTFNKIRRQTTSLLDATAAKYGFEAAIVMCGNTVNEDGSLAFVHTTATANNFFETRCHADNDAIIGHLKSHVYNNVSLDVVAEAFGDERNDSKHKESTGMAENSKTADLVRVAVHSDIGDIANDKADVAASSDDVLTNIKDGILRLIETAGGDVSRIKRNNFPWTSLVQIFGDQGLVMHGWPSSSLMPGELRTKQSRAKGITTLKVHERRDIYHALENNEITIVKVEGKLQRKAIQESQSPIIIGAPPQADSNVDNAQRMYVDGSIDFEGPARLPQGNAATRIKPRKIHASRATAEDPIVLSSGEDTGKVVKPAKKPKPRAAVSKMTSLKMKGKSKYVPTDDSSDDDGPAMKGDIALLPDVDVVAPTAILIGAAKSSEDYQAPGPAGKRKA